MIRVLFVCLGNICRSPTAHGVFLKKIEEAGLSDYVETDSAGTAAWHVGKKPDSRSCDAAAERGYDLSGLRARQAESSDFDEFDYVLAMDKENLSNLRALHKSGQKTSPELFLEKYSEVECPEVPDPYYGGADGFGLVLDLIEDACDQLISDIRGCL